MKPINILTNNFTQDAESRVDVSFTFGIGDIDYTNTSIWNSTYIGEPIFDPNFNASSLRS
jgi:hypothetical protein